MRTPDEWRSVIVSKTIKPNAKYTCVCASDIAAIQSDARAGMIEVSELDGVVELIEQLIFTVEQYGCIPDGAKTRLDRLKALRNEHTS